MKKIAITLIAAGILVGASTFADNNTQAKPPMPTTAPKMAVNAPNLNIGVINLAQVLKNSPQMKNAATNLRTKFKPRQDKIMSAQKTFEADESKLKRDASTMSQNDLQALQNKVNEERRELARLQEDYMQDLQSAQQEVMQSVLQQLDKIVESIATKGHYDLILQRNNVAYASQRVDITPQVVKALEGKA